MSLSNSLYHGFFHTAIDFFGFFPFCKKGDDVLFCANRKVPKELQAFRLTECADFILHTVGSMCATEYAYILLGLIKDYLILSVSKTSFLRITRQVFLRRGAKATAEPRRTGIEFYPKLKSHAHMLCANHIFCVSALLKWELLFAKPYRKRFPVYGAVSMQLWFSPSNRGRERAIKGRTRFPFAWFREFVPKARTLRGSKI